MSDQTSPLLPCPFCGGEAQDIGNGRAAHACYVIDIELRTSHAAWNQRVPEAIYADGVRLVPVREPDWDDVEVTD